MLGNIPEFVMARDKQNIPDEQQGRRKQID